VSLAKNAIDHHLLCSTFVSTKPHHPVVNVDAGVDTYACSLSTACLFSCTNRAAASSGSACSNSIWGVVLLSGCWDCGFRRLKARESSTETEKRREAGTGEPKLIGNHSADSRQRSSCLCSRSFGPDGGWLSNMHSSNIPVPRLTRVGAASSVSVSTCTIDGVRLSCAGYHSAQADRDARNFAV